MFICVWHFAPHAFFISRAVADVLLQHASVAKCAVSVTFGASLFGPKNRSFCNSSKYVTFPMVPATMVRELTVSVTFGASHVGFFVAFWRRPFFGHPLDMARGDMFGTNATTWCQSSCSWHTLPSRGAAQLRSQHCLRCWRFLVLPGRVLFFLRGCCLPRLRLSACGASSKTIQGLVHFAADPNCAWTCRMLRARCPLPSRLVF